MKLQMSQKNHIINQEITLVRHSWPLNNVRIRDTNLPTVENPHITSQSDLPTCGFSPASMGSPSKDCVVCIGGEKKSSYK